MTGAHAAQRPPRAHARGPVVFALEVVLGLASVCLSAWMVGVIVGIGGCYTLWKNACEQHARDLVVEDLGYITAAPQSLLVGDTGAFSARLIQAVRTPYEKVGALNWYARWHPEVLSDPAAQMSAGAGADASEGERSESTVRGIEQGTRALMRILSQWTLISMWVAQDVLLRLSVALYALPAFALACLLGVLDGMVRRDLRRWGGGRESSFVYHHAKHYTVWALTGGFGLYLAWPLGGFNPAYMVLVFTVLVAVTLSTTVGAFKKYL